MKTIKEWLLGKPKDLFNQQGHSATLLTIFFAWIGLGADGLSSACYGPEEAYLALGHFGPLALWLAAATAFTVFIIAFAYNHVISLFPDGGGGYKVASRLLGEKCGLLAGVALLMDYILTIVISIVSGTDAMFSLLPPHYLHFRIPVETLAIIFLTYLNMRGIKESIRVLMPIFVGFIVLHVGIIIYGIFAHSSTLPSVTHAAVLDSKLIYSQYGLFFTIAIFFHAYAQGGGTYTGLEAVSNNVNTLTEPRVRTGQWTMLYMAVSLSLVAGGIILLYLLWNAQPQIGKTLNAIVFSQILGQTKTGHILLIITLAFEAGLLFAAANTGFLGGPSVLANMANDTWVPKQFTSLSTRLVKQNGLLVFGVSALLLLFITDGHITLLVILYSLSVFLAFSIATAGLTYYFVKHFKFSLKNIFDCLLLITGTVICTTILLTVAITSFRQGSWLAMLLIAATLLLCSLIRKNYTASQRLVRQMDTALCIPIAEELPPSKPLDPTQPTAIILTSESCGAAMHTLLTINRLFQHHYKNYIFLSVGVVDSFSAIGKSKIQAVETTFKANLAYLTQFCQQHGMPATSMFEIAVDPVLKIAEMAETLVKEYPNSVFYASQLVFPQTNWIQKILHNNTALAIQRRLYSMGFNMMTLPVKVKLS